MASLESQAAGGRAGRGGGVERTVGGRVCLGPTPPLTNETRMRFSAGLFLLWGACFCVGGGPKECIRPAIPGQQALL